MADKNLLELPLAVTAAGALVYGIQNNQDVAIPASVLQGSEQPQGNNLVYAGPPQAPGGYPTFRPLVIADIPDLSTLYLGSNGGTLVGATINNSTIVGGTISGATAVWDDDKFSVRNVSDTTKIIRFNASTISAGQTRIYSWPDANGQVVTDNATQNLTNKSVFLRASGTNAATFRIPHGQPPSAPVNGDMWTTNAGLYVQANNATIGPLAAAASSTVTTFNGRQGAVTLTTGDVTTALGYTPWNTATNLVTSANITAGTVSDSSGNLRTAINDAAALKVNKAGDVMTGQLTIENAFALVGFRNVGQTSEQSFVGGWGDELISRAWNPAGSHGTNDSVETYLGYGGGWRYLRNGAVRFEINANGNTLAVPNNVNPSVGVTTFAYRAQSSFGGGYGLIDGGQTYGIYLSNGNFYIGQGGFGSGVAEKFRLNASGDANITGVMTAGGGFGPGSDPRLKDESSLKTVDNALEKVYNLNVRCGKYHSWYNPDGKERLFLMADKAMEHVAPEVLLKDAIEKDGTTYDGWSADQMIALLVKAVQELKEQVDELKEKLNG